MKDWILESIHGKFHYICKLSPSRPSVSKSKHFLHFLWLLWPWPLVPLTSLAQHFISCSCLFCLLRNLRANHRNPTDATVTERGLGDRVEKKYSADLPCVRSVICTKNTQLCEASLSSGSLQSSERELYHPMECVMRAVRSGCPGNTEEPTRQNRG